MDVPFNPSTSCQGATHVFVVFLLHGVTVGFPAVVGRLGLVLDTGLGFWGHGRTTTDGRNRAPPLKPPWFFEQETATGNRNPISVFLRAKKVAVSKTKTTSPREASAASAAWALSQISNKRPQGVE